MSDPPAPRWGRDAAVVVRALLPHPTLWVTGLTTVRRLSRRHWWRRPPFLPVPGEAYWHFRLVTALGGEGDGSALRGDDVVAYLRWCQRSRPPGG